MRALVIFVLLAVIPGAAFAQAAIAGSVTDPSDAPIPGVLVEASSPALIEKTRTAITDGSGRHRIEGSAGAGGQIANLTLKESKFLSVGADEFEEVQSVTGSEADTEPGLGPQFNSNSCASCHAHPAIGGTSPAINPQVSVAP